MAEWTLHLKFDGDETDYSSAILEGAKLKECVGAKGKHATQSCSLSIHDPLIAAKVFNTDKSIDAKIYNGDSVWFEGVIRPYATLNAERAYEKPVELEVIDYTELLRCYIYSDLSDIKGISAESRNKCIETAVWKDLSISDIIRKLFELTRINEKVSLDIPDITIKKAYFCLEAGKYIDDVIKELLYEYCYDFRFSPGKLTVFSTAVVDAESTPVEAEKSLSSFNLSFKVSKEDQSNDGVRLQYGDYHTQQFLIYSENTRFDGHWTEFWGTHHHKGLYYKNDMHDNGSLDDYGEKIPWKFTADALKNKTIIDVLSVTIDAELQDEKGVDWSAHCDDFDKDGGKPYVRYDGQFDKWFGKGWGFVFKVYGSVFYQDKTLRVEKVLGLKPEEKTADYIEEFNDARKLVANIQARNERAVYVYSFSSSEDIAPGAIITLNEDKVTGLNAAVRILSRVFNPLTGLYSYEAEGAGAVSIPEIFSSENGGSANTDVGQAYIMALEASKDSFLFEDPEEQFDVRAYGIIFSQYGCTPSWSLNGNAISSDSLTITIDKSELKVGSNVIACSAEYEGAVITRECSVALLKANGEKGEQGFGIVATIERDGQTEEWWKAHASVGVEEIWADSASLRNGCRIGDLFAVVGTSEEGNGHIAIIRSTSDSGDLKGISISHTLSRKGVTRIFQYRLSKYGDIEGLGADTSSFAVDGNVTLYDGNMLFDDSTEWVDEASRPQPDESYPFLWERFSDDEGSSWSEPRLFQSYNDRALEILVSKPTYDMSARGNVTEEQTITASARIVGIAPDNLIWTITKGDAEETATGVSLVDITIPVNYKYTAVKVEVRGGGLSSSLTIAANIIGDAKPVKLNTIDRSATPPAEFPSMLDDGSSLADGDYILCYEMDGDKKVLVPYRFDASDGKWKTVNGSDSNYSEIVSSVAPEILKDPSTVSTSSAIYGFFQNLFASDAFINALEAMFIRINGAIFGGGYDENGNNRDNKNGFYLSREGTLNAVSFGFKRGSIDEVDITNATLNGKLISNAITTYDVVSSAPVSKSFTADMHSLKDAYSKLTKKWQYEIVGNSNKYNGVTINAIAFSSENPQPSNVSMTSDNPGYHSALTIGKGVSRSQNVHAGNSYWMINPMVNNTSAPIYVACSCSLGGNMNTIYIEHWNQTSDSGLQKIKHGWAWKGYIFPGECIGVYTRSTAWWGDQTGYATIKAYASDGIPFEKAQKLSDKYSASSLEAKSVTLSSYTASMAYARVIIHSYEISSDCSITISTSKESKRYTGTSKDGIDLWLDLSGTDKKITISAYVIGYEESDDDSDKTHRYEGVATIYGVSIYEYSSRSYINAIYMKSGNNRYVLPCNFEENDYRNWILSDSTPLILPDLGFSSAVQSNRQRLSGSTVYDYLKSKLKDGTVLNYSSKTNTVTVNGVAVDGIQRVNYDNDSVMLYRSNGETYRIYRFSNSMNGVYTSLAVSLNPVAEEERAETKTLYPKASGTYNIGSASRKYSTVYANSFNGNLSGNVNSEGTSYKVYGAVAN